MTELERMLLAQTPNDPEKAMLAAKHSFSVCDFHGRHCLYDGEKENLFEVILSRPRYIIDSNAPNWKNEYQRPENATKAFIATATLLQEQRDLEGVLLKEKPQHNNLFAFAFSQELKGLILHRVDEYWKHTFAKRGLAELRKRSSPRMVSRSQDHSQIRREVKREILEQHGVNTITDIPNELRRTEIAKEIEGKRGNCFKNLFLSLEVARLCYELLLIEDRVVRDEFAEDDYENVFGDSQAVIDALFLNAHILTKDGLLTKMASYADVRCYHVPRSTPK